MLRRSLFQTARRMAIATALALSATSGAMAVPALSSLETPSALTPVQYGYGAQARRHRYEGRGYRVNRYGYGNYVRGPNGGFGGYPAGSAGAQILRQKQHDKCRAVPERC